MNQATFYSICYFFLLYPTDLYFSLLTTSDISYLGLSPYLGWPLFYENYPDHYSFHWLSLCLSDFVNHQVFTSVYHTWHYTHYILNISAIFITFFLCAFYPNLLFILHGLYLKIIYLKYMHSCTSSFSKTLKLNITFNPILKLPFQAV